MIRWVSQSSSSLLGVTKPAFISEWICDNKLSCFRSSIEISSGVSRRFGLVDVIGGTYLWNTRNKPSIYNFPRTFNAFTHRHWWKIFGILHDRFRCTFDFFSFSMCNATHKQLLQQWSNRNYWMRKTWAEQSQRMRVGFFFFSLKWKCEWKKSVTIHDVVGGAHSPKPGHELLW